MNITENYDEFFLNNLEGFPPLQHLLKFKRSYNIKEGENLRGEVQDTSKEIKKRSDRIENSLASSNFYDDILSLKSGEI